ncbi:hypothetical protein EYF80_039508 [Liparis tanakae]|uniref:Uncharacterized protein n=1 Tax=Liparis tanakae TaxID=230148 RepID=A0A4Z2GBK1_9TELE|nr:hypothetical protein EYF80_039508 [Liparis tanakae]
MTGEDEGVAVQAGAVRVDLSAGVVDGVVLVVGVNHPVVIVYERRRGDAAPQYLILNFAGSVVSSKVANMLAHISHWLEVKNRRKEMTSDENRGRSEKPWRERT